jgi:ClpP class serine protease
VFVGSKAYQLKLIDQIGGKNQAITWLKDNNESLKDLDVRNVELVKPISKLHKFLDYSNSAVGFLTNFFNKSLI